MPLVLHWQMPRSNIALAAWETSSTIGSLYWASHKTKGRFIRESECEAKFVTSTMVRGKYSRRRFAKVEHNISTWAMIIRREFDDVKFASHSLSREVWTGLNPHTQAVSSRCVGYRARFKLIRLPCGINKPWVKGANWRVINLLNLFFTKPHWYGVFTYTVIEDNLYESVFLMLPSALNEIIGLR